MGGGTVTDAPDIRHILDSPDSFWHGCIRNFAEQIGIVLSVYIQRNFGLHGIFTIPTVVRKPNCC